MNSGYSGVDPKFPPSDDYSQSSYLSQHSEYYNHMQAAQHYGYGATAAAMSGYPAPRDPMGYASNYYQQCSAMTPQQVHNNLIEFQSLDNLDIKSFRRCWQQHYERSSYRVKSLSTN